MAARLRIEPARASIEGRSKKIRHKNGKSSLRKRVKRAAPKTPTEKRMRGRPKAKKAWCVGLFIARGGAHCSFVRDFLAVPNLTRSCAPDSLADACERRRGNS